MNVNFAAFQQKSIMIRKSYSINSDYYCLHLSSATNMGFFKCLRLCKGDGGGPTNMGFLWVFKIKQGEAINKGFFVCLCKTL